MSNRKQSSEQSIKTSIQLRAAEAKAAITRKSTNILKEKTKKLKSQYSSRNFYEYGGKYFAWCRKKCMSAKIARKLLPRF